MSDSKKLQSSLKQEFIKVIIGILLSPVIVGLIILYAIFSKRKSNYWEIRSNSIVVQNEKGQDIIGLQELNAVQTLQTSLQSKLSIADLSIETTKGTFTIKGIEKATIYAEALQLAIDTIKANQKPKIEVRPEEYTDLAVGGLDKMNDLVGLWQAGMISDEDFYAEQEKFKRDNEK